MRANRPVWPRLHPSTRPPGLLPGVPRHVAGAGLSRGVRTSPTAMVGCTKGYMSHSNDTLQE